MVKIVSFCKIQPGCLKAIVEALKKIPEIVKILTVTGEYDLLLEFEVDDPEEMYTIYNDKIDILKGMIDINSHYILAKWEK